MWESLGKTVSGRGRGGGEMERDRQTDTLCPFGLESVQGLCAEGIGVVPSLWCHWEQAQSLGMGLGGQSQVIGDVP